MPVLCSRPPPRSLAPELAPATLAEAAPVQATAYPPILSMPGAPVKTSAPRANSTTVETQAVSQHSQRMKCINDWKDLLEQVGTCSSMCVTAIHIPVARSCLRSIAKRLYSIHSGTVLPLHTSVPGFRARNHRRTPTCAYCRPDACLRYLKNRGPHQCPHLS